jgi:hypothetical protein
LEQAAGARSHRALCCRPGSRPAVARLLKAELLVSAPSGRLDAPPGRGAPGFRAFDVPGHPRSGVRKGCCKPQRRSGEPTSEEPRVADHAR